MNFLAGMFVFLLGILPAAYSETCTKMEVSATSYTTQDATVLTSLLFIAEFTLKCGNGVKGIPLHSEVNGRSLRGIVPNDKLFQYFTPQLKNDQNESVRINDENRYQVSWTDDPKSARTGDYHVVLYDDEGYAAYRKAIRNGEDASSVNPLVTIVVNFPGAYQGPWVNSEFMAAVLSIAVWYLAFSAKSKLLA